VNATTTRCHPTAADPRAERRAFAPFAALPHDIAADPRLSPTDVRVLLALLFYARSKAACWPSDRSLAVRIGRSVGTVQRSLRRLEALGLVERRKADNPTGRELVLRWRATPTSLVIDPLATRARDEGECEEKENRPSSAACCEGTPPPAGEKVDPLAPPSAEDLAQLVAWANGPDPALARFGRAALRLAGVAEAVVEPAHAPQSSPAAPQQAPAPTVKVALPEAQVSPPPPQANPGWPATAAPPWSGCVRPPCPGTAGVAPAARPRPPRPAAPPRRDRGPRRVLEPLGPAPASSVLAVWMTRRSP
jgi:hypothetical protein